MSLKLEDFYYDIPEEKIAKHPAVNRGDVKLLLYKQGVVTHHNFTDITNLIRPGSFLLLNDTKVIPARMILNKNTGARIEIVLLEPIHPSKVHEKVMNATQSCTWKCMIGNARKWKDRILHNNLPNFRATRIGADIVKFDWDEPETFSDLLTRVGKMPIPPYLDREAESEDKERYQTVYAKTPGAVAAPTAGLHFTKKIIAELKKKRVHIDYITLHVSVGTFRPIKTQRISEHPMHSEHIWITKQTVKKLLKASPIIAGGTTTMRTLESLYWFGVKLLSGDKNFHIMKNDPYQLKWASKQEALNAVLSFMESRSLTKIGGQTEIFLYPGYSFRICQGLITNYHLPGSTLILLVAAFIGQDWKKVYQEAINRNYRFLSYGDSSLLLPHGSSH